MKAEAGKAGNMSTAVEMYDSTEPGNITPDKIVAAYYNGRFAWSRAEINRHPGHILIAVKSGLPQQAIGARALDIEGFDATPDDAAPFVHMRLAHGHTNATLYCNRSNLEEIRRKLSAAGLIPGRHYRLWVATLDGTKTLPDMTGVWAIQHTGGPHAPFDISDVHLPHDFTKPTL
jgi:hypothetical protein